MVLPVGLQQRLAQPCQIRLVRIVDDQLIGIGPPIRSDRHRFPTEDQLGPLSPNLRHRRDTSGVTPPVTVPSILP